MDLDIVREYWNRNADAWADLSGKGYDLYRDYINTPAFLKMLPALGGKSGLDIGCGEGHNTQKVAEPGANVIGIDISDVFVSYARRREENRPGLKFIQGDAAQLPFEDQTFDFCLSFMALMDTPDPDQVIREAYRVLKNGGVFQFSITHPIFLTKRWKWVKEEGKRVGVVIGDYFEALDGEVDEWIFGNAPEDLKAKYGKFQILRFTKTLSGWVNLLIEIGFRITRIEEPYPTGEALREHPILADAKTVPYFLIVQCEKEGA